MLSNYVISFIRTFVPTVVGIAATWLATYLHIVVTPSSQAGFVVLAVGALISAYYAGARYLETHFGNVKVFGVAIFKYLLGVPAQPTYAKTPAAPVASPKV